MLILRHMILHSTTFPSWLMFNIRNKLIQITQGGTFQLPTGTGYLDYLDIDVKEAGALPWSPELGRDKITLNRF